MGSVAGNKCKIPPSSSALLLHIPNSPTGEMTSGVT